MKPIIENYQKAKDLVFMIPKVIKETLKEVSDVQLSYLLLKRLIINLKEDIEVFKNIEEIENDENFKQFIFIAQALFKMQEKIDEIYDKLTDVIPDIKILYDVIKDYKYEQKKDKNDTTG